MISTSQYLHIHCTISIGWFVPYKPVSVIWNIFLKTFDLNISKKLQNIKSNTYRYIDDVLSINNPYFENYLGQMYTAELEIKDTTESNTSASYSIVQKNP